MSDALPQGSAQNERYLTQDGKPISLERLCETEPEWAANRIRATTAALADVLSMIGDQTLVRSTKRDGEPDWHSRMLKFVQRLSTAQKQLPEWCQEGGK